MANFTANTGWNISTIPTNVLQKVSLMTAFIVLTLVGNITVLVVLFKQRRRQRGVYSFFISLAISDILIAVFSMPTEVFWDIFGAWLFGNFACKVMTYVQCVLFASTAFVHMCISYDRYEAVCKPLFFTARSHRNKLMILISWILALVIATPQLFIFLQVETGNRNSGDIVYVCRSAGYTAEWQRKVYVTWTWCYVFLVPCCSIAYCYLRIARVVWKYDGGSSDLRINHKEDHEATRSMSDSRHKLSPAKLRTLQVTVCILSAYTFCWIPYFTVSLLNVWSDYKFKDQINSSPVGPLAQSLCWFSSCINPIIYGFFHLPHQVKRSTCCGPKRPYIFAQKQLMQHIDQPMPINIYQWPTSKATGKRQNQKHCALHHRRFYVKCGPGLATIPVDDRDFHEAPGLQAGQGDTCNTPVML